MDAALPESTGGTLTAVERAVRAQRAAEAKILQYAAHWADLQPAVRDEYDASGRLEQAVRFGGEGTPWVREFAPAELAVSLEVHPLSARRLMADALDLRHRFPLLWGRTVTDLRVPSWVARKVAALARELPEDLAVRLDARIAGEHDDAERLPPSRLFAVVEAAVLAHRFAEADREREAALAERFVTVSAHRSRPGTTGIYACVDDAGGRAIEARLDRLVDLLTARGESDPVEVLRARALVLLAAPEDVLALEAGAAPAAVRPGRVVLHLHLTDHALFSGRGAPDGPADDRAVARWEGVGPVTRAHLVDLLGHHHVTVQPVHLPAHARSRDSYEYAGDLREAVLLTVPRDCYPYAPGESRRADLDHTTPYDPHGPTGQTRLGNAGPLSRHHHRIKTAGALAVRQPVPGTYVWATPHHRYLVTDATGTRRVDRWIGEAVHGDDPLATEWALAHLLVPDEPVDPEQLVLSA